MVIVIAMSKDTSIAIDIQDSTSISTITTTVVVRHRRRRRHVTSSRLVQDTRTQADQVWRVFLRSPCSQYRQLEIKCVTLGTGLSVRPSLLLLPPSTWRTTKHRPSSFRHLPPRGKTKNTVRSSVCSPTTSSIYLARTYNVLSTVTDRLLRPPVSLNRLGQTDEFHSMYCVRLSIVTVAHPLTDGTISPDDRYVQRFDSRLTSTSTSTASTWIERESSGSGQRHQKPYYHKPSVAAKVVLTTSSLLFPPMPPHHEVAAVVSRRAWDAFRRSTLPTTTPSLRSMPSTRKATNNATNVANTNRFVSIRATANVDHPLTNHLYSNIDPMQRTTAQHFNFSSTPSSSSSRTDNNSSITTNLTIGDGESTNKSIFSKLWDKYSFEGQRKRIILGERLFRSAQYRANDP